MDTTLIERVRNEPDDLSLGAAIKVLRERGSTSARALSLSSNLSESYCGKVEKGEIEPSLRAFASIVRQLGLTPREVHVLVMREALRAQRDAATAVAPMSYGDKP